MKILQLPEYSYGVKNPYSTDKEKLVRLWYEFYSPEEDLSFKLDTDKFHLDVYFADKFRGDLKHPPIKGEGPRLMRYNFINKDKIIMDSIKETEYKMSSYDENFYKIFGQNITGIPVAGEEDDEEYYAIKFSSFPNDDDFTDYMWTAFFGLLSDPEKRKLIKRDNFKPLEIKGTNDGKYKTPGNITIATYRYNSGALYKDFSVILDNTYMSIIDFLPTIREEIKKDLIMKYRDESNPKLKEYSLNVNMPVYDTHSLPYNDLLLKDNWTKDPLSMLYLVDTKNLDKIRYFGTRDKYGKGDGPEYDKLLFDNTNEYPYRPGFGLKLSDISISRTSSGDTLTAYLRYLELSIKIVLHFPPAPLPTAQQTVKDLQDNSDVPLIGNTKTLYYYASKEEIDFHNNKSGSIFYVDHKVQEYTQWAKAGGNYLYLRSDTTKYNYKLERNEDGTPFIYYGNDFVLEIRDKNTDNILVRYKFVFKEP